MEEVLSVVFDFVVGRALPFIVLIGVLILVHELGHFTMAKLFKIRVERFSIGFGPRIFGWNWGETEYRVAWIPLGGYVKMKGDDPTQAEEARNIPGSFLGAAVWKRILVVLAGPGVNLILPIFVLAVAAAMGTPSRTSYIGSVRSSSPAEKAGIQPGDQIVAVNGVEVQKWDELTREIGKTGEDDSVAVTIERGGKRIDLVMSTIQIEDTDLYGSKIKRPIIGIAHYGVAATAYVEKGSAAAKAGLETGDVIVALDDQKVHIWNDFEHALRGLPENTTQIELTVERRVEKRWYQLNPPDPNVHHLTLALPAAQVDDVDEEPAATATEEADPEETDRAAALLARLNATGFHRGDTMITALADDSPAAVAGLERGDRIVRFGDRPIDSGIEFSRWIGDLDLSKLPERTEGTALAPVHIVVDRGGKLVDVEIAPILKQADGFFASRDAAPWLGLAFVGGSTEPGNWLFEPSNSVTIHERVEGFGPAIAAGFRGTGAGIGRLFELARRLVQGRASVRDSVGGPLAIGVVAGMAARGGLVSFLMLIAELSIILGVMNLLPIPVLDGGHLMFFGTEAVLGKPPSLRVREIAQQVGLVLLLALMVFVMFNDVSRFF